MATTNHVRTSRIPLAGDATMVALDGSRRGPLLALLGGVHGDEDEGVLAVHLVMTKIAELPLSGTVRAVAPANPLAWAAQSRSSPLDDANLARCFPGDAGAGPTASLARSITDVVIDGADMLIDLHSAGLRYEMPFFCGFTRASVGADKSERAAVAFGAPVIWSHAECATGRSLSVAAERGIPAIYAECSGGGSIRASELDAYVAGVLAVMADLGMIPEIFRRDRGFPAQLVYGAGDLDDGAQARHCGLFVSSTSAGSIVSEGHEIGRLFDFEGRLLETHHASRGGMVMFLRRQARTKIGDVLYVLARLDDVQE